MRSVVFFCSVFILTLSCQDQSPIIFQREHVTIEICDDHVAVQGIYFFHNTTSAAQRVTFFYPVPVDTNHLYPDTFMVSFPCTKTSDGMYYDMVIAARASAVCTVSYVQRIRYKTCTYITTTTRNWRHPIEQADFTVIAPDTVRVTMNYPVHDRMRDGTVCTYQIRYQNFYPDEDLVICWSMIP